MTRCRSDCERFSFSRLKCFEQCPYQYYLSYIVEEPKEDNALAEYGSMCHKLLEEYLNGKWELYELPTQYSKRFFKEIKNPFPRIFGRNLAPKYFDGGLDFFNQFEGLSAKTILGVEENFNVKIYLDDKPFVFNGFIDALYIDENDKLVVHDWKSKSSFKNKKELAEYQKQLYLYSFYVYEKYKRFPDILRLYCFREQKAYDCDFSVHWYVETMQWMCNIVRQVRDCEIFEQNRSSDFYCGELCSFRHACTPNEIAFLEEENI